MGWKRTERKHVAKDLHEHADLNTKQRVSDWTLHRKRVRKEDTGATQTSLAHSSHPRAK